MAKHRQQTSLNSRVPVSTTGKRSPEQQSHPGPIGLNSRHERLLLQQLVDWYGWHAAEDGNLYSPMPSDFNWGDDAA